MLLFSKVGEKEDEVGWVAWEMFNLVIDMLFILDIVLNCVPRPQPQASLLRPCLT